MVRLARFYRRFRELGEPFRRDALSKPVRFLDKHKAYV
jgi:sulfoacetaldehyde acetyltransferase